MNLLPVVFHPSPFMVKQLDELFKNLAPDLQVTNVVEPDLLAEAMDSGLTDALKEKVRRVVLGIPTEPKKVILCSCSTIGGCAEELSSLTSNLIIRIDRPMAELAVKEGRRIGVAAAVASTLEPTRNLLESVALEQGCKIEIKDLCCESAWSYWTAGDAQGYYQVVAKFLEENCSELDVIVLAQGSLAPVAEMLTDLDLPILSSPTLAVERVKQLCAL